MGQANLEELDIGVKMGGRKSQQSEICQCHHPIGRMKRRTATARGNETAAQVSASHLNTYNTLYRNSIRSA